MCIRVRWGVVCACWCTTCVWDMSIWLIHTQSRCMKTAKHRTCMKFYKCTIASEARAHTHAHTHTWTNTHASLTPIRIHSWVELDVTKSSRQRYKHMWNRLTMCMATSVYQDIAYTCAALVYVCVAAKIWEEQVEWHTRIGIAASLIGASYKWMDDAWKTLQSPRTGVKLISSWHVLSGFLSKETLQIPFFRLKTVSRIFRGYGSLALLFLLSVAISIFSIISEKNLHIIWKREDVRETERELDLKYSNIRCRKAS